MYLLHLQNAMFIEMVQPFVRIADWYKGYIIGDCFFLWIETLFFAAVIRRFAKTKAQKRHKYRNGCVDSRHGIDIHRDMQRTDHSRSNAPGTDGS